MAFQLVPIIDRMLALYQLPRGQARFEAYLEMLQGPSKKDIILPIGAYNPMGKEMVADKLRELKALGAEEVMKGVLEEVNERVGEEQEWKVVLNLADDVGGAWSNYFTTDFSSKFDINALVKRRFCTPYFWTSETYSTELILQRTKAYLYRNLYWVKNGKPQSLEDHCTQEIYVQQQLNVETLDDAPAHWAKIEAFYTKHKTSEDYSVIFNFFYGDEASRVLEFKEHGASLNSGWEYAQYRASQIRFRT